MKILFWIAASVADAAAVNPNGIKSLVANGLRIFFIKDKPAFGNGHRILPKNADCPENTDSLVASALFRIAIFKAILSAFVAEF